MSKRLSFYGLIGLASLCIFFLAFNQRYSSYLEHRLQPVLSDVEIRPRIVKIQESVTVSDLLKGFAICTHPFLYKWPNIKIKHKQLQRELESIKSSLHASMGMPTLAYVRGTSDNATNIEIQEVLDQQRKIIEREMQDYEYPDGKYGLNISSLEDLVMEKGGTPMRSIILTSWRSGSTFLGDVVNAHPANFYHYEPLLDFGIVQIRGPPLADEALTNIESLLNCNFHNLDRYLEYGKTGHPWVFNHNTHLWRQCQIHKKICWEPRFVSKFCQLFPFQSMKLVRLRLSVAENLLAQKRLGIRLILLVRDPRGILQSRKHREWCPTSPDCSDPALVCADMVSDFSVAVRLIKKYPRSFRVVRYEDLSVEPYKYVKELYAFYGLDFHVNVKRFLDTHTKSDVGGVSSTFRNSKVAPFHWRTDLDFEEVDEIQRVCSSAMRLWGYVIAINATHQKEFDPLTEYQLQL